MDHIERFIRTIERQPVDRPATWIGEPVHAAIPALLKHFGVDSFIELKKKVDDDVYHVNIPYQSPTSSHVAAAFDFAKKDGINHDYEERTLTAPGFFEDYEDPEGVNDFDWPDPEQYIDPVKCRQVVEEVPDDAVPMVLAWSAHFQDACAAFGMETALIKMMTEPEMFKAVIDRIMQFYLKANEIFYEATKGKLKAVLIGNDFGSQQGLMLSPALIRELVFPGTKQLIDQAHAYGLKVIHHSCGCIYDIIPDLIELGADAIHPIQALAHKMEADRLARDFGGRASFCGGVDAQNLMVHGTPEQIIAEVKRLAGLFPTGLIISPSHEAILPDTPPANVEAIFAGVHAL
ncbi:MAG: uroporphyrinogen decarboxylase family protein [Propionivibrio sp.]